MTFARRAAMALVTSAILVVSRNAAAADVGVFATKVEDAFAARLGLQLEQLGFSVARERERAATSRELVLVEITESDVVVYDVTEGGALQKRPTAATNADAIRSAEEIRAHLLPLVKKKNADDEEARAATPASAAPPVSAPVEADADAGTTAPPASPPPIELAFGGAASFGASEPGFAAVLGVAVFPRPLRWRSAAFGIGAAGVVDLASGGVSGAQGTSTARAFHVGPEAILRVAATSRLSTAFGLRLFASHLRVSGTAVAPFTSQDDAAWTWSPTTRVRLAYDLGPLALFAEGRVGLSMPGIAVRFAGGTVEEWGRPWGLAGGGALVSF